MSDVSRMNRARLIGCEMDMLLPEDRTCGDCAHFNRCHKLFGCDPSFVNCDWDPSRFREKEE